jgi:hypothetical protein
MLVSSIVCNRVEWSFPSVALVAQRSTHPPPNWGFTRSCTHVDTLICNHPASKSFSGTVPADADSPVRGVCDASLPGASSTAPLTISSAQSGFPQLAPPQASLLARLRLLVNPCSSSPRHQLQLAPLPPFALLHRAPRKASSYSHAIKDWSWCKLQNSRI